MSETSRDSASGEVTDEKLRQGHAESLESVRDLAEQVEAAETAEGEPEPSQADADETAATGI